MTPPIEPWPEDQMTKKEWEGHNSICRILREVYAGTEDPELKLKIRICTTIAKRMHKRLMESLIKIGEHQADARP